MTTNPAAAITKAASKQTYYTIRFLVDRERVDDAYRAYAYFRWVDDTLDAGSISASERLAFIERQKDLLDKCYRGELPQDGGGRQEHQVLALQRVGVDVGRAAGRGPPGDQEHEQGEVDRRGDEKPLALVESLHTTPRVAPPSTSQTSIPRAMDQLIYTISCI